MSITEIITRYYCRNAMERSRETNVRNLIAEIVRNGQGPTNVEFWRMVSQQPVPEGERICQWTWNDRR